MGFLLAGVFIPFDLLAAVIVAGIGVYICVKAILYLRQGWRFIDGGIDLIAGVFN